MPSINSRIASTGVARMMMSASSMALPNRPSTLSKAFMRFAPERAACSASVPTTVRLRSDDARRANPSDVPIKPVPITVTCATMKSAKRENWGKCTTSATAGKTATLRCGSLPRSLVSRRGVLVVALVAPVIAMLL